MKSLQSEIGELQHDEGGELRLLQESGQGLLK